MRWPRQGVENVLALRGDPPQGQERWTKTEGGLEYSRELVELLRADYPFAVGRRRFPGDAHPRGISRGRPALSQGEGRCGRAVSGHPDVLRQPLLLRLRRARAGDRDRRADHPRRHADPQLRWHPADDASSRPPTFPTRLRARARPRRGDDEAVAELGVSYATLQCAELLDGGAPGHPLHHAQPLARDSGDPRRAQAHAALGRGRATCGRARLAALGRACVHPSDGSVSQLLQREPHGRHR